MGIVGVTICGRVLNLCTSSLAVSLEFGGFIFTSLVSAHIYDRRGGEFFNMIDEEFADGGDFRFPFERKKLTEIEVEDGNTETIFVSRIGRDIHDKDVHTEV